MGRDMTNLQAAQKQFDALRKRFKARKFDDAWIEMFEELFLSGWEMGYDAGRVCSGNPIRERTVPDPGPPQRVRDI